MPTVLLKVKIVSGQFRETQTYDLTTADLVISQSVYSSQHLPRRSCLDQKCCQLKSVTMKKLLSFYTKNKTNDIKSLREYWRKVFAKSHVPEPEESIEHILAHSLGSKKISDVYKNFHKPLTDFQVENIAKMCQLRLKRMPVQYIIKEWDFRDMTLKMEPPVFIPRPETESLIDIVLENCEAERSYRILEICCGTGAISLALLKALKNSTVVAVDRCSSACKLTRENARMHQLENRMEVLERTIGGDENLQDVQGSFDIIVSNPPYVPSEEMSKLQPEIGLYEDLKALNGGSDGLDLIKMILKVAEGRLRGGRLYLEVDTSHPALITKLIASNHPALTYLRTYKDLFNNDRFVMVGGG